MDREPSQLKLSDNEREKAESTYDKNRLISSLEEIKSFHQNNKTDLILNEPASREEIKEAEFTFGCKLPSELIDLWSWHNGENTNKFIWYHRFLSIGDSIAEYQKLVSENWSSWREEWVPVFEFEGEWYGVECRKNAASASPIIFYFVESGEKVAYTNLTTYMQFISQSIRSNAISWSDGWWEGDIKRVAAIHEKLNVGIKFPYHVGN